MCRNDAPFPGTSLLLHSYVVLLHRGSHVFMVHGIGQTYPPLPFFLTVSLCLRSLHIYGFNLSFRGKILEDVRLPHPYRPTPSPSPPLSYLGLLCLPQSYLAGTAPNVATIRATRQKITPTPRTADYGQVGRRAGEEDGARRQRAAARLV